MRIHTHIACMSLLIGGVIFAKPSGGCELLEAIQEGNLGRLKAIVRNNPKVIRFREPETQLTPLHYAACYGETDIMRFLLQKGASANAASRSRRDPIYAMLTPLHLAAAFGSTDAARLLLENKAKIDAFNSRRQTALMMALLRRHFDLAILLLERGGKLDTKDLFGANPLMLAATVGHTKLVTAMLDRGVSLQGRNRLGATVLHYAAARGHAEIVRLLLNKGADPTIKDKNGKTARVWAIEYGYKECVRAFIDQAGNARPIDYIVLGNAHEAEKILAVSPDYHKKTFARGATPLHLAARFGNTDIITLLLNAGADIRARDEQGATPLHSAAKGGNLEAIKLLLDRGADLKTKAHMFDHWLPIHFAAFYGHTDAVDLLIRKGCDVDEPQLIRRTPLHCAARGGRLVTTRYLLGKDADPKALDKNKHTPIHQALYGMGDMKAGVEHVAVVRLLLEHGARLDGITKRGRTPLDIARMALHGDMIRLIEKAGGKGNTFVRSGFLRGDDDAAMADADVRKNSAEKVSRAMALFKYGQIDKAVALYTEAIDSGGLNRQQRSIALAARGNARLKQNKTDKALADYGKAIEVNPRAISAYVNRARIWNRAGKFDKAIADCDTALRLKADYLPALVNRANAFARKGAPHKAIKAFDHIIASFDPKQTRNRNYAITYMNRGKAYSEIGKTDQAVSDFTRAIELGPRLSVAYDQRGAAFARNGAYERAAADYRKAIDLGYNGAIAGLANLEYSRGRFAEAAKLYKRTMTANHSQYGAIMLFLARRRARAKKDAALRELKLLVATHIAAKDAWPSPILRLCLGGLKPEQVLAAAKAPNDPATEKARTCEAYYYVGQWYLVRHKREKGAECMQLCLDHAVPGFVEPVLARAELERLAPAE